MRIFPRPQANRTVTQSHSELEAELVERTLALQNLSQQLLRAQDEERRKVARDLHDSTGQTLAALKISVSLLQRKLQKEKEEAYKDELSGIEQLADQALQEIRTTSYLLHPLLLDAAGFNCAARWYIAGFAKRSGTKVRMDFAEEIGRLPDNVEVALFRVLQESLANVYRHAGTSEIDVSFRREAQAAILEVRDYGRGIPKELPNCSDRDSGVGLAGMRDRLNDLNGKLEIEPADPGTRLRATVPLLASMPRLLQPQRNKPGFQANPSEWLSSALRARVISVLAKRIPSHMPRWSTDMVAITVLAITGWIAYSDHRSAPALEASNALNPQATLMATEPKVPRPALKMVRDNQTEVDYIAEDTIRYFAREAASQQTRVGYKQVNFGEDVTVRYFTPRHSDGRPLRPVANLAQPLDRSLRVSDKSVSRKLAPSR